MTIDAFITRLQAENATHKLHKLNKPATADAIAKWEKKHPELSPLPKPLTEFLLKTNGVTILLDKYALADVGGRMRLVGLKELAWAGTIMLGEEAEQDEALDLPRHWLGLGWDDNHDWSPVCDLKSGEVRIASHIGSSDSDWIFDSFEDFLEWVAESMLDPHQEELAAEAEAKKKPKAKGKRPAVAELDVAHVFAEPHGRVMSLSMTPDGRRAVSAGWGPEWHDEDPSLPRTLRLFDLPGRRIERVFDLERQQIMKEVYESDGSLSEKPTSREKGVECAAISPDGKTVAAYVYAEREERLQVFNADSGVKLAAIAVEANKGSIRFSPDGRYLLAASGAYAIGDGLIDLYDARTFEPVARWDAHKPRTNSAVFTPDSSRIISSGWNRTIKIWEVPGGKRIDDLPRSKRPVIGLAVSRDGKLLAMGSLGDRVVRVLDLATRQIVAELPSHTGGVQGVAFSPNANLLATNDGRGKIRVWDLARGALIAHHQPPRPPNHIADPQGTVVLFLPDGQHLLSGGWDDTVRLLKLPG